MWKQFIQVGTAPEEERASQSVPRLSAHPNVSTEDCRRLSTLKSRVHGNKGVGDNKELLWARATSAVMHSVPCIAGGKKFEQILF